MEEVSTLLSLASLMFEAVRVNDFSGGSRGRISSSMDERSTEIDPSSNVADGESDTTGKHLNFKLDVPR